MSRTKARTKPTAKPAGEIEIFDEGQMTLRLKSEGSPDKLLTVDLMPLRMACEKCEEAKLEIKDGYFVPTARFLTALAKEFSNVTGHTISETVAYQLWPVVNAKWYALKKNMSGTPN